MKCIALILLAVLTLVTSSAFAIGETPNQIAITEYKFAPNVLNVTAGTKVTWVNHDDVPHTIIDTSPNKIFRSSALDTNDSYSYTFLKPGTYRYFCSLHPQMVGTINVTEAK